jgi:GAF domain
MHLEFALSAISDPNKLASRLARSYDLTLSGGKPDIPPRKIIAESWNRIRGNGIDPDRGSAASSPVSTDDVQRRRSQSRLIEVVEVLRNGLASFADDGVHMMVITDAEGCILWREGNRAVRAKADSMGFVEGARWTERAVGTNGIGTSLVLRRPLQVFAAEHFIRTCHPWVCSASPVHDPVDGQLLGAVDVSGPASTVHPSTLALTASVTQLAETSLRTAHGATLEHLRSLAAPVLARIGGEALVCDRDGWVAACQTDVRAPDRLRLPPDGHDGHGFIPPLGWCVMEPLFDGWLVRVEQGDTNSPVTVELDLRDHLPHVTVINSGGRWRHRLSTRHAEILLLLAMNPGGRSAAELSTDLFGDPGHTLTVRAEVSRLRRHLGSLISERPYRFLPWLDVVCTMPRDRSAMLPRSVAPGIQALRGSGDDRW